MVDMQQIVGDSGWIASARLKWSLITLKIVQQAKLEVNRRTRLRKVVEELEEFGMSVLIIV